MQENYETSTNIIEHPSFPHMSNYWTSHLRNTSLVKESESKHSEIGENTDFGAKRHSVTWNTRTSKSLKECSSATAELWAVQKVQRRAAWLDFFFSCFWKKIWRNDWEMLPFLFEHSLFKRSNKTSMRLSLPKKFGDPTNSFSLTQMNYRREVISIWNLSSVS